MGLAVKWGIVSTADINRKVIPGAKASPKVDLVAVASRDQARAEAYAREWEIPRAYGSYEALLADPEIEAVYISLPNTLHCEWSIQRARGRQARALREAALAPPGGGRSRVRRRRAHRPPADARRSCTATTRRPKRSRSSSTTARSASCGSIRSAFSYGALRRGQHPPAHRGRGRRADGRRLLQRQRLAPARRRAGARLGRGVVRAVRDRLGLRRDAALSRATWSRPSTAAPRSEPRRARGDRQRGLALPRRPLALQRPGHRAAPRRRRRADRDRAQDSYRLELENLSDAIRGEAELLLGREDALGQARALEALHRRRRSGAPAVSRMGA